MGMHGTMVSVVLTSLSSAPLGLISNCKKAIHVYQKVNKKKSDYLDFLDPDREREREFEEDLDLELEPV